MKYIIRWSITIAISTLVLSACSTSPKSGFTTQANLDRQTLIENQRQWNELSTQSNNQQSQPIYLSDLMNVPKLNNLIDIALKNNPKVLQDLLAFEIQAEKSNVSKNNHLPTVNASVGATRTKKQITNFTASASVRWEADLWQELALDQQVEDTLYLQSFAFLQATKDSLTARIMQNWLQFIHQTKMLNINTQLLALLEKNESLILNKFRNGLGNLEDINTARIATEKVKSTLINDQENLAITKRSLATYLGQNNHDALLELESNFVAGYPDVLFPLSTLTEQNLQNRPDLKAAFLSIKANDLNTKVAYKALLPSFSLQASLNDSAESLRDALFASPIWSLLSQLTLPLFQKGQLKSNIKTAELKTAQSYQAYRENLLNAVTEVENRLGQEKALSQRHDFIQSALAHSQIDLKQYQKKYRSGLVGLNDLISAQQATFNLEADLENLLFQRLSNRIGLGLALGLGAKNDSKSTHLTSDYGVNS
ncbi:TolC family protein [Marinomonas sp. 2405UD68-3]|uniref:TolC family protein n=1 Tax=Marinomonas sp. 2405UD68-3 TaxID=3391835 RepID=UPI0039C9D628